MVKAVQRGLAFIAGLHRDHGLGFALRFHPHELPLAHAQAEVVAVVVLLK